MSYRTFTLGLLAAASLVGPLVVMGAAQAADLDGFYGDAPPPEAETKVEFGSGWYIRGDIGATHVPQISSSNVALGAYPTAGFASSSTVGYTGSLAGGYAFNHWFRADLMADFHQPLASTTAGSSFSCANGYGENAAGTTSYLTYGTCTGHYNGKLRSYDVLVNGYFDLGTWHGITPYVGAGVGMSFGHYATSATYTQYDQTSYNIYITDPISGSTYHYDYDRNASGEYYNLAWALMGGVSFDVYDHTKLDIGYRYLNLGHIPSAGGSYSLTSQEVRAGLRYMIDN